MAVRLWVVVLTLAALLVVDRQVPASAGKPIFSRMGTGGTEPPPAISIGVLAISLAEPSATYSAPCDHVAESLDCPQTSSLVYGTDQVTYDNDCQLCLTRM
ncbi:serine protease inhibitor Kazal-type 4 [Equus caballus]|uniref:serine protease inhibitor Kazal-type 4 n=1 Tax=Equus caballus TaxID=9796 RepID=UPI0038B2B6B0